MNPGIIIIGAIEQLIVWTIIMPQTGWWFAFFGIAAVWNIVSNLGSVGTSDSYYSKDYYDDYRSSSSGDEGRFETTPVREESFSTKPVSSSASYEDEEYNEPEIKDEVNILSKAKSDTSRKMPPKENSDLLRSKGFKPIKKIK